MLTRDIRARAVLALRTTTAPQVRFHLATADGGRCALGVLSVEFDLRVDRYDRLEDLAFPTQAITNRNDGCVRFGFDHPWTFDEIADWLETLPVSDPAPVEEKELVSA